MPATESKRPARVPSYRRHKASGQAVVTIDGRDIYLGRYNTATSRVEYNRLIAEWASSGGSLSRSRSTDLTVAELLAAFTKYAKGYHTAGEQESYALSLRPVKTLYARTNVADFGPRALKAVRQTMIEADLARATINRRINRIRHVFKWGVENEMVPPSILHGLQAVAGLRHGKTEARESEPVKPVPVLFVEAVLPHVSRQVAAMIELQCITGMRSGEVTAMRGCDMNTSGKVWTYTPEAHKTAWRGHKRTIYLGPKAQSLVKPFLKRTMEENLFSPADAESERHERTFGFVSADRKTKAYPCEFRARERRRELRRNRGRRQRPARTRYTSDTYRQAVEHGIAAANKARLAEAAAKGIEVKDVALVPHWHPHQLRHNAATELRREHGIEVARIILGHRSAAITEVYAEVDHARAIEIMGKIG